MLIKWKALSMEHFTAQALNLTLDIKRLPKTGKWVVYGDGKPAKERFSSSKAAMAAVARISDVVISKAARENLVHAQQHRELQAA